MSGLICAYLLDGNGGGELLSWESVRSWKPEDGPIWIHLDYASEDSQRWLAADSGIDEISREALLARDPRPRCVTSADGMMLILRSVNLNEGAVPEDMVSTRAWLDEHRIVTMRHRKVKAVATLRKDLAKNQGPMGPGDFIADLANRNLESISRVSDKLDDAVAELEDMALSKHSAAIRHELADLRRQAIALRRYIAPQREVLTAVQSTKLPWLREIDRAHIRESTDRLMRTIEDLDAARDRAAVTQEEVASRLAEQLNQRLYTLSVVAAIFLPLGFFTGLMGVNVGGIPGTTFKWGFAILCAVMVAAGIGQLWLFRKMRWL